MYMRDHSERHAPPYNKAGKKRTVQSAQITEVKHKNMQKKTSQGKNGADFARLAFISIIVAGVLCAIIYNDTRITTLSDEASSLKTKLDSYKTEQVQLKYQYEKIYSASAVEEYAQTKLGMTVMDKNYIEYIELPSEDKVERPYQEVRADILLVSEIIKGFNAIVEYLN